MVRRVAGRLRHNLLGRLDASCLVTVVAFSVVAGGELVFLRQRDGDRRDFGFGLADQLRQRRRLRRRRRAPAVACIDPLPGRPPVFASRFGCGAPKLPIADNGRACGPRAIRSRDSTSKQDWPALDATLVGPRDNVTTDQSAVRDALSLSPSDAT
jgi:hypothetical protein